MIPISFPPTHLCSTYGARFPPPYVSTVFRWGFFYSNAKRFLFFLFRCASLFGFYPTIKGLIGCDQKPPHPPIPQPRRSSGQCGMFFLQIPPINAIRPNPPLASLIPACHLCNANPRIPPLLAPLLDFPIKENCQPAHPLSVSIVLRSTNRTRCTGPDSPPRV